MNKIDDEWYDDEVSNDFGDDYSTDHVAPCPKCGREIYDDVSQCVHCGEFIDASSANWSRWPRWLQWIGWSLLALATIAMVATSLFFFD